MIKRGIGVMAMKIGVGMGVEWRYWIRRRIDPIGSRSRVG